MCPFADRGLLNWGSGGVIPKFDMSETNRGGQSHGLVSAAAVSNSLPSYLASYLPSCLPGYFVNQSTFTSMALLNLTRYILPKESQHGSVEDLMR